MARLLVQAAKDLGLAVGVSGAMLALAVSAALVWWCTPTLHVDLDARPAVAHMELMGDYPFDIRSIAIARDDSDEPVWKIVSDGDFFQIHSVPLAVGANPVGVRPYWGHARNVVPSAGDTFPLTAGVAYRITVCPSATLGLCRRARFVLPSH